MAGQFVQLEALLESLLVEALAPMGRIDTGAFATDLKLFAEFILDEHLSGRMDLLSRVNLESRAYPAVFDGERIQATWRSSVDEGRAFVRRAIHRGELPADTSPARLMEVVLGMIGLRVSSIGATAATPAGPATRPAPGAGPASRCSAHCPTARRLGTGSTSSRAPSRSDWPHR